MSRSILTTDSAKEGHNKSQSDKRYNMYIRYRVNDAKGSGSALIAHSAIKRGPEEGVSSTL